MSDDPKVAYIEFQTTIKNGMIEIPAAYRERLPQQVRVILWESAVENRSYGYFSDSPLLSRQGQIDRLRSRASSFYV